MLKLVVCFIMSLFVFLQGRKLHYDCFHAFFPNDAGARVGTFISCVGFIGMCYFVFKILEVLF